MKDKEAFGISIRESQGTLGFGMRSYGLFFCFGGELCLSSYIRPPSRTTVAVASKAERESIQTAFMSVTRLSNSMATTNYDMDITQRLTDSSRRMWTKNSFSTLFSPTAGWSNQMAFKKCLLTSKDKIAFKPFLKWKNKNHSLLRLVFKHPVDRVLGDHWSLESIKAKRYLSLPVSYCVSFIPAPMDLEASFFAVLSEETCQN